MTAKEDLRELVEAMSETEAAKLLRQLRSDKPRLSLIPGELDKYPPEERGRRLQAFFDQFRDKDAYLSDEEWEEFARDFDAQRPHRPLFSEYLSDSGTPR